MNRKKTTLFCSILIVALLFVACSRQENTGDATGTQKPNDNSMLEDITTEAGEMVDDAVDGVENMVDDANNAINSTMNSVEDIGVERAKEIALNHASKNSNGVTFTKTEKGSEDGKMVYEIEFRAGNTEYDYEIDAMSGAIRQSESGQID